MNRATMTKQKKEDLLGNTAFRFDPGISMTLNIRFPEKLDVPISHNSSTSLTA
jgi:hypothetical protein